MSYATTKLMEVIDRFCESNEKVKEYLYSENEYTNPSSAAGSLRSAIKRFRYAIRVSQKNGKVYMVKL